MPPYTSPSESDCLQSRTAACFKIVLSGQPRPPSATACALLDAIGRVKSKFRLPSSKFDQALGYYVPSILGNGRTFRFVGTYVAHRKNTLPLRGEGSYNVCAGWSSQVARWAHNPKVAGSNPAPATKSFSLFLPMSRVSGKPYFVTYCGARAGVGSTLARRKIRRSDCNSTIIRSAVGVHATRLGDSFTISGTAITRRQGDGSCSSRRKNGETVSGRPPVLTPRNSPPARWAPNPAGAGSLVQIQPPQPTPS